MKYQGFIRNNRVFFILSEIENHADIENIYCTVSYKENNEDKELVLQKKIISEEIPNSFLKHLTTQQDSKVKNIAIRFTHSIIASENITLLKFSLYLKNTNGLQEITATNGHYSLAYLFPKTEKEASESLWFKSSTRRHADPETLSLIANNTVQNESLPATCRINALVVFLYKLIELGQSLPKEKVLAYYNEMLSYCDGIGRTNSSKKDGKLLQLSLMTAMWHYLFSIREITLTTEIVDELTQMDFSAETNPLYSLNLSCALLFQCLIGIRKDEIIKTATRLINVFYHAVSLKADNSGWFVDYKGVHEKALVAMLIKEYLQKNESTDFTLIERGVKVCFRVTDKKFINNALDIIKALND